MDHWTAIAIALIALAGHLGAPITKAWAQAKFNPKERKKKKKK